MRATLPLLALALAGCSLPPSGQISGMTLKAAMVSTADALGAAEKEVAKVGVTGFEPCDVTATFAVVSTDNGTLGVTAASVPLINLGATSGHSLTNTIVIDYKSAACIAMTAHQISNQTQVK